MKREYWGLRSLAYRIKENRKGHYMLMGLEAKPAFMLEMERQLRLNEDILRFLTLSVDKIEEALQRSYCGKTTNATVTFEDRGLLADSTAAAGGVLEIREEFRAREVLHEDLTMDLAPSSVVPEDV
jgi:small subunit ribosomal protein S6